MTTDRLAIPGYRIERELGRGGMATVYLAQQESLNRPVALKVMNPVLAADDSFRQRFLNEGRIIGQLSHSHIVSVYDIGIREQNYYLSMEYLPGGSLRERIRQGMATGNALEVARMLASALDYAHRRGFIHRDVKPLNVLFREDDTPVLTDFGIAKILGADLQLTQTGFALGSAGYMSPEQALGKPLDRRADIYSFGVLLWEMLTGSPPFQAADAFALALQHATAPVPQLAGGLARYQPLLDRLLAKQPEDRVARLAAFLTALQSLNDPGPGTSDGADTTVIRPAPAAEQGSASGSLSHVRLTDAVTGLNVVQREQHRMVARLPDLIESLRIEQPDVASDCLDTSHALLNTLAGMSDHLLQQLGTRNLAPDQRDRLHLALDRQARIDAFATQLQEFGELILQPAEGTGLQMLRLNMIEGLDAILLILRDAVLGDDPDAFDLARSITGDRSELMQNLRQSYLTDETRALATRDKRLVLQLTGQFERLIWTLGGLVPRLAPASL